MTTTGPALRKLASHRSIHEGAFSEARDLTDVVLQLYENNRKEDCLKAAKVLVEHWETRVIAHADTEDEGLFQEVLKEKPKLANDIQMLMRDHDLIRMIVQMINDQLTETGEVTKEVCQHFHALLTILTIHGKSEEIKLLKKSS